VLHGIGGVGKTTLAAELIRRITEREPGRLAVLAASGLSGGQVTVDQVLAAIARTLRRHSPAPGSVLHQAAAVADQPDLDWQYRLDVLHEHVLGTVPLLVVLDNFEDNLGNESDPGRPGRQMVADQDLAALLASLATRPGQARMLITTRYPFVLPGHAETILSFQHLGPLTPAETMKLAWALPALDKLTPAELERVWQMVGSSTGAELTPGDGRGAPHLSHQSGSCCAHKRSRRSSGSGGTGCRPATRETGDPVITEATRRSMSTTFMFLRLSMDR
jgi:hypothetical protein